MTDNQKIEVGHKVGITIMSPSDYAGRYTVGGVGGLSIFLKKKPFFIHRLFMQLLLGWEWLDETRTSYFPPPHKEG